MRYRIIYMCSVYLLANMEATEPMVSSTKVLKVLQPP